MQINAKKHTQFAMETGFRAIAIIFSTSKRKGARGNDASCCTPLLANKIAQS